MIQPVRPQDASGVYGKQINADPAQGADAAQSARRAGRGGDPHGPAGRTDQVEISNRAREFSRMLRSVTDGPELREANVEAARARLASGEYEINAADIARALVEARMTGRGGAE